MFAREAIEAGADTIVACGGDGTVNEVVNGIEGTEVALGIIPAGTANDFARQVGIPDDPERRNGHHPPAQAGDHRHRRR